MLLPVGDVGFGEEAEEAFAEDGAVGEEGFEFGEGEEAEFVDADLDFGGGGFVEEAPEGEPSDVEGLPGFGEPVDEEADVVWFDEELACGCLDPEFAGNAAGLVCESLLSFPVADVFDDGVGEEDVEGLIWVGECAGVALAAEKAVGLGGCGRDVWGADVEEFDGGSDGGGAGTKWRSRRRRRGCGRLGRGGCGGGSVGSGGCGKGGICGYRGG